MIPKIIHLCWLGGDPYPGLIRRCLRSWERVLPDYEVKLWNRETFDVDSVPFVRDAVSVRQWAPAADYIRLWALNRHGGIYLDSDVYVRRSFDDLLSRDFFTAVERLGPGPAQVGIQAAVLGSIPGHPFLKECMKYYEESPFFLPDGTYAIQKMTAPGWYAKVAEASFGFKRMDKRQELRDGMLILPSETIHSSLLNVPPDCRAIHCCNGDWNIWAKRKFHQKAYRRLMPLLLWRISVADALRSCVSR